MTEKKKTFYSWAKEKKCDVSEVKTFGTQKITEAEFDDAINVLRDIMVKEQKEASRKGRK